MSTKVDTFYARLRKCRDKVGMTRAQLGVVCGISPSAVANYESPKKRTVPKITTVAHLAEILQVDPCWLAFGIRSTAGR